MQLRVVRLFVAALVAVGVSVSLLGPAGAATDPADWSESFCAATLDWLEGAQAGAEELEALATDPTTTPEEGAASLVEFLETGVEATKGYAKAVKAEGAPDVPKGKKIQAVLVSGITGSETRLAKLAKAAKRLPTESERKFTRAGDEILDDFANFLVPWTKALDKGGKLDTTGEIDAAFLSEPSCVALQQQ